METVLLVVAALGAFLFAIGESLWGLVLRRALIGAGVAACLMGSFKAMSEWFPMERLPLMNGLIVAFGGLGAMVATAPTEAVVAEIGWRYGFMALAMGTAIVAVAIWFVVPERARAGSSSRLPHALVACAGFSPAGPSGAWRHWLRFRKEVFWQSRPSGPDPGCGMLPAWIRRPSVLFCWPARPGS